MAIIRAVEIESIPLADIIVERLKHSLFMAGFTDVIITTETENMWVKIKVECCGEKMAWTLGADKFACQGLITVGELAAEVAAWRGRLECSKE